MEELLIEFINTMDLSMRRLQEKVGDRPGMSRLTLNQLRYIDAVYQLGEPAISEVAAKLEITKASVTAGIDKLVKLGYVVKTQSSADRRVFRVRLTTEGERMVADKYAAIQSYGAFIRAALEEDEARQFEQAMRKIVDAFQQSGQESIRRDEK
jgi:MarR family transcriptional regulator, organic hydroperoxide resistance regulator